jgi:acetylornithine deacetylase/succinyl-diaminopimelate desuccinylase-like protein
MMKNQRQRLTAAAVLALAAAAATVLVVYNRRMESDLTPQLYVPHPAKMTPDIALLQEYVRIDTSNPPGDEVAGARWLCDHLRRGGVSPETIESAPRRANVYARIRGRTAGQGLLLLSHIDVVPAENRSSWSKPPFSASIAANMLWGRGAADMKGITVCHLRAFIDVAKSGRMPEHDIVFLAVADEEKGGEYGTRWLIRNRPDVFQGCRYVIGEGGITEVQKEEPTYFGIEIGAKEITDLQLNAPTREQLQRVRIALEPYFHPPDALRVLPGVRSFFRSVAPLRVQFEPQLRDIDATIAAGKLWLLPPAYGDLVQNTLWAGAVREENGRFSMRVMMANLPEADPDARIQWLAALIRPTGASIGAITRKEGPIPMSSDVTPLFALLTREVHHVYGNAVVGPEVLAASTSDSRFLRPLGFDCYGFQPFPLDFFQTLGIHGVNERVRLDWFVSGVQLTRRVVADYAFGTAAPH